MLSAHHEKMSYAQTGSAGKFVNCPSDDCDAMHEIISDKTRCNRCASLIRFEVNAEVVRDGDARHQDPKPERAEATDVTEPDTDDSLGGFDEPFSVPDNYAEQTIV